MGSHSEDYGLISGIYNYRQTLISWLTSLKLFDLFQTGKNRRTTSMDIFKTILAGRSCILREYNFKISKTMS